MSFARLKETFLRLPRHVKLIGVGSFILAVSTVLPWYADLDSYRIGDQFLGITGPAAFVGIVILILAGLSFWIFSYHVLPHRMPRLPVREGILHLSTAIESLFLLILVNSIYFHPKFGVNITLKESRFGMAVAFISAIVLLIGAYMKNKEEIAATDEVGKLEPLIKLEQSMPTPATSFGLRTPSAKTKLANQSIHAIDERERPELLKKIVPRPAHAPPRNFVFGEERNRSEKQEDKTQKSGEGSGTYMIRMDL